MVEWRGLEIHPEIPAEGLHLPPAQRARFGGLSDVLHEEAQKAGLPLIVPEIIPKSRRALEATEYAQEQGEHDAFHALVWQKFYGAGEDLNSWAMLRDTAVSVGLNPDAMQEKTERGVYTAVIDTHLQEITALGATSVPLFIFDNKYAVIGLQPYVAFQEVMTHIAKENRQD